MKENHVSLNGKINLDLYDNSLEEDDNFQRNNLMILSPCPSKEININNRLYFPKSFPGKKFDYRKKWKNFKEKKFQQNKHKDKKSNYCETPHNTGQYLSHIHQEYSAPKRKFSTDLDEKIIRKASKKSIIKDLEIWMMTFLIFLKEMNI